jgi:predicted RNase H-like HicB family nuclease
MMSNPDLRSVIYREGAYFVGQCLDVDVSSFGHTPAEAMANLHEGLELYFA